MSNGLDDVLEAELRISRTASDAQIAEARAVLAVAGGQVARALIDVGCDPERVLTALSAVSGIPPAPQSALAQPAITASALQGVDGIDGDTCDALCCAPIGKKGDVWQFAFTDAETAARAADYGLPPLTPYLALESHIRGVQARLFGDGATTKRDRGETVSMSIARVARASSASSASPGASPGASVPAPFEEQATVQQTATAPTTVLPVLAHPPAPVEIGPPERVYGGFEPLRVLGKGGMATVHLAKQRDTGRIAAVKVMAPHLAGDAQFVERFRREIRVCASLSHPNIVQVLDFGEENGALFMVSEYVDGGTLRELVRAVRRLPPALVVDIAAQLLSGLALAHRAGVVHRDLKPANILLGSDGTVKLGDFGIAKSSDDTTLTRSGALHGTPAYMSPEQVSDGDVDARSDLFSVGTILRELLTGANPYASDQPHTSLMRIAAGAAKEPFALDPTLPLALDDFVVALSQQDPAARPQTCAEALERLAPLLAIVDKTYPFLLRDTLRDPATAIGRLRADQAAAEEARATAVVDDKPQLALFALLRAAALYPSPPPALLSRIAALAHGARVGFDERPPGLDDLERAMALNRAAVAPARRAADLCRAHGNPHLAALYLRRALRLRPDDAHMARQLEGIVGSPLSPFDHLDAKRTRAPLIEPVIDARERVLDEAPSLTLDRPIAALRPSDAPPPYASAASSVFASSPAPPPPPASTPHPAPTSVSSSALTSLSPSTAAKAARAVDDALLSTRRTADRARAFALQRPFAASAIAGGAFALVLAIAIVVVAAKSTRSGPPAIAAAVVAQQRGLVADARRARDHGDPYLAIERAGQAIELAATTTNAADARALRAQCEASVGLIDDARADLAALESNAPADVRAWAVAARAKLNVGEPLPPR